MARKFGIAVMGLLAIAAAALPILEWLEERSTRIKIRGVS